MRIWEVLPREKAGFRREHSRSDATSDYILFLVRRSTLELLTDQQFPPNVLKDQNMSSSSKEQVIEGIKHCRINILRQYDVSVSHYSQHGMRKSMVTERSVSVENFLFYKDDNKMPRRKCFLVLIGTSTAEREDSLDETKGKT